MVRHFVKESSEFPMWDSSFVTHKVFVCRVGASTIPTRCDVSWIRLLVWTIVTIWGPIIGFPQ